MIARQDHDKRLLRYCFVFEIGLVLPAEESDIKRPALQVVCEGCRVVARNPDFDIEQFVAKNACGPRQPIDFLPVWKPMAKVGLARCAARRAASAAASA